MELFSALLTVALFWLFVHVCVTGYRAQGRRKAGPLLLKLRRPGARIQQVLMASSAVLILVAYTLFTIELYGILDNVIMPALGLCVVLGLFFNVRMLGVVLELHQHGIVPVSRARIAFAPWHYVRYCRWARSNRLLVKYQDRSEVYRIAGQQREEATAVLARHVEVRELTATGPAALERPEAQEQTNTGAERLEPEFRRRQFGLRTLLLFVLVASCGFSWLGIRTRRAAQQRAIIDSLESRGLDPKVVFHSIDVSSIDFSNSRSKPGDNDLKQLAQLPRLEWLILSGSPVTDTGLSYLEGLNRLELLDLSRTQITDAGVVHLQKLTRLRWLNLLETQISEEGLQELHRALPDTEISR